jgi:hypothetical protein
VRGGGKRTRTLDTALRRPSIFPIFPRTLTERPALLEVFRLDFASQRSGTLLGTRAEISALHLAPAARLPGLRVVGGRASGAARYGGSAHDYEGKR